MGGKQGIISLKDKLLDLLKGDKKIKFIVAVGILGIILILLSDVFAPNKENKATTTASDYSLSQENQELEKQIYDMVATIDGVGRAKVIVTLENSAENIYAKEEKRNTDVTKDAQGGQDTKTTQKDSTEEKYIFVDDPDGGKQALLTTQKAPLVKGVVVVCEGGDDTTVRSRIIDAVTTALDIGSNRVCVTKMSNVNK